MKPFSKKKQDHSTRRNFLKTGSLFGLALSLGKSAQEDKLGIASHLADGMTPYTGEDHFTLLITADLHGQLFTHDEFFWENDKAVYRKRGGIAVLKKMIDTYRKKNKNTLLYDGGDFFHGHAIASMTRGEALIPIINALDYDLILPGNWEVVYKKKQMLFDMGHSSAAKICANMWHDTDDELNGELVYPPYWIKYIAGAKIGFIGYTDHLTPKRQSPAYSAGLKFRHAEVNAAKYIRWLKDVEGCGIIFIMTHMGLAQQVGLANNSVIEGADFIVGADTHERVRVPILGKYAKVIECGAFGSFLGKLDIRVKKGRIADYQYELLDVDPEKYPADAAMQKLVESVSAPYHYDLSKVIGTTRFPLVRYFVMETPMDNLITDAIKWKFKPDIALSNGFRFCQPLAVSESGTADITREFLWNMLPVDSEAKIGWVKGSQLWSWLEKELQNAFAPDPAKRFGGWFVRFSGMQVNFTIGNETGKRVNWIKINGKALDLDKEYSIVACEREGDPDDTLCRIEHVKEPRRLEVYLHAVIEEYLAAHSPVAPQLEGRATATDQPDTLLTQLQGTTYVFH